MKKAKIVCTIGPSSENREIIRRMIENGMDVARLNFSHGNYEWFENIIKTIREEAKNIKKSIAILQDLQGVKIRISDVENEEIHLNDGMIVEIYSGNEVSNTNRIFISYPSLIEDVEPGEDILIDDGILKIKVIDKLQDRLIGQVIEGGILKSRKGINLPFTRTSISSFTEKDKSDLLFGIKMDVDYVAVSFVRNADDIELIKEWANEKNIVLPPVIAKIEKREALKKIHEILDVTDGIMVARGDLGVELPAEEVPFYQKMLIDIANQRKKIVITATQMLESMTEHSRPTRAEASDVANAVLDGTDALMLSAETASGKYPVESVKTMSSIISFTEESFSDKIVTAFKVSKYFPEAIASGAVRVAQDIEAKAIVVFTYSGFSALLISKLRPFMPVVAFTPDEKVYRRLSLLWAVIPMHISKKIDMIDNLFLKETETELKKLNLVKDGDAVVFVASSPFLGNRNVVRLHKVGDPL
ncbi:pyruvate kinase [Thermodesulfovibrio yellowstonii]|uniref:Pyruvate kinase n=1 Tax=Thermodesulfovibrio yellowstonii TaxID=28262 RepID=A0A9W6LK65_9BACT|nr:pyruvate kinase [Thermodesulfovibrio islandicus]GLI53926.1 pyruvate kinase [Thermodesulfovibrio islandicus]